MEICVQKSKALILCLTFAILFSSCALEVTHKISEDQSEDVAPRLETAMDAMGIKKPAKKTKQEKGTALRSVMQTQQAHTPLPPALSKDLSIMQSETDPKKIRRKGPRYSLSAQKVDLQTILLALSKEIEKNIIIDPDINQVATIELKNVTLEEALDSLVKPLDLSYEIRDNFIRVSRNILQTRMFRLNYVISKRIGSSRVQASSGLGTSQESTGTGSQSNLNLGSVGNVSIGGGGSEGTASSVISFEESNLWKEIGIGLQTILGVSNANQGNQGNQGTLGTQGTQGDIIGGSVTRKRTVIGADGQEKEVEGDRSFFSINQQSGLIMVRTFPEDLLEVAEFLEEVEGSVQRQVFIEAKVIEVTLSKDHQLGIDWSLVSPITITNTLNTLTNSHETLFQGAVGATIGFNTSNINVVIDALSEQGEISLLSSPKIATLNNQRAIIKVGTEDVFFTTERTPVTVNGVERERITVTPQNLTIGLVLDVLPQINPNGEVMLSINTSFSEKTGEKVSPIGDTVPILDVRESNNVVLAKNGQTIVIGGLMKTRTETKFNGVPLLEDIPYLGRIFQKKTSISKKSELIIMMTPNVVFGHGIDEIRNREKQKMKKFGFATDEEDFFRSFN